RVGPLGCGGNTRRVARGDAAGDALDWRTSARPTDISDWRGVRGDVEGARRFSGAAGFTRQRQPVRGGVASWRTSFKSDAGFRESLSMRRTTSFGLPGGFAFGCWM